MRDAKRSRQVSDLGVRGNASAVLALRRAPAHPPGAPARPWVATAARRLARTLFEAALRAGLVRRWLTWRARSAWGRRSPIAFVCLGNICRSPFAERVARDLDVERGKRFLSAGFVPVAGRRSPPQAVQAADRQDVDLLAHRSRPVDEHLVRTARAIYVFDRGNWVAMVRRYPRAALRVHPIGALADAGELFISDPFGQGDGAYEETYAQIERALRQVAHR